MGLIITGRSKLKAVLCFLVICVFVSVDGDFGWNWECKTNLIDNPQCQNLSGVAYLLNGLEVDGQKWDENYERDLLPPWTNYQMLEKGQKFGLDNITGVALSYFYGLTMLLAFPQISHVLLFTGNSGTPKTSARRYAATMVQIFLWMRKSLNSHPRDFNWALRSISTVHRIHTHAARKAQFAILDGAFQTQLQHQVKKHRLNKKLWSAFERDLEMSNIPLSMRQVPQQLWTNSGSNLTYPFSQFAFAITQFAFFGLVLIEPEGVLIYNKIKEKDLMAFSHFWAVMGYAMGLENGYNIGYKTDLYSVKRMARGIFDAYFIPVLFHLKKESKILIEAFLAATADIVVGLDPEFLLRGILKNILKIPAPNMDRRRTLQGKNLDFLVKYGAPVPTKIFPKWNSFASPLASLYHYQIGFKYFGFFYKSDESIAKHCYFYRY